MSAYADGFEMGNGRMAREQLLPLSKSYAIDVIRLCEEIRRQGRALAIVDQLLRSGTSIGANIHEANYASSRADFINKLRIALKECYESDYWLDLFHETNLISDEAFNSMRDKCGKIRKMLISSVSTAQSRS